MERQRRPITERFWEKVDTNGPVPQHRPELGPCWIWTAQTDKYGYGKFSLNKKKAKAHRVAYILTYGPIPDNLLACHRCDNPICVNPGHLFLGTVADNANDRASKAGCIPSKAIKLTIEKANEIRRLRNQEGLGYKQLAQRYNVAPTTIQSIINGKTWRQNF